MSADAHLSDLHKQNVQSYLKYFRVKRDFYLNEIQRQFDDTKDMRLLEDMYTADDVKNIIDGLCTVIMADVQKEFESVSHKSALYFRQMFAAAEQQNVQLQVNINVLDDESQMGSMRQLEVEKKVEVASIPSLPTLPSPMAAPKLAPLQPSVDPVSIAKIKELEEANEKLKSSLNKIQAQWIELQKKNNEMKAQMEASEVAQAAAERAAQEALASAAQAQAAANAAMAAAAAAAEVPAPPPAPVADPAEIVMLKAQIDGLKTELASRMAQSKQFQEMKKIVNKKNQQIKELRDRLSQVEPAPAAAPEAEAKDDDSDDD
eukprot:TRINITY_DN2714_c0_g1_i1.p1 TRINITY_DN2714_c0_g1~~TRINITY_DN2714_c0_g1_i1.p1  ORF type:complete len:338 (-),score=142.75 TRINITY_DN2714_c0_g1_i1:43-996(-)